MIIGIIALIFVTAWVAYNMGFEQGRQDEAKRQFKEEEDDRMIGEDL